MFDNALEWSLRVIGDELEQMLTDHYAVELRLWNKHPGGRLSKNDTKILYVHILF